MEKEVYDELYSLELKHWWFNARRSILKKVLDIFFLKRFGTDDSKNKKSLQVLEVGCGTGGNLDMLHSYGELSAIEMDSNAYNFAKKKSFCDVKQHVLPDPLPFNKAFDLICMFDVLEHIEDDLGTLNCLKKSLVSNGRIVVTVPAYQWLWSHHDVVSQH